MVDGAVEILVIEDEEILRQSIMDHLEDRNFRVLGAENGKVGLQILNSEKPDLIIKDLRMPEMDGLEVMKFAGELSPDTPVIVVSGTGNIGDAVRALRLGAWDYILKPIDDMAIISHAVNNALERVRLLCDNREYQLNLERKVLERTRELESANAQLRGVNERLRNIVESTRNLSICQEVNAFGCRLLEEFAKNMLATGGSLYSVEEAGLRRMYSLNSDHAPDFIPFPLAPNSVLQLTIQGGSPLLVQDIAQEPLMKPSGWENYSNGSLLAFPLRSEEDGVAAVITLHCRTAPPFVEQDREIGAILASLSSETLRAVRAVERLRDSELRFRELVELLPEAVFETDRGAHPVFLNKKVFEVFKYNQDDLDKDFSVYDLFVPEDRGRAVQTFAGRLRGEEIGAREYTGMRKDGSVFPVLVHAVPVRRNGKLVGSRGIVIDITERKQAEQRLRQAHKMESIGTLAGGIAHDFNNILTAVFGYTQLAQLSVGNPEKQEKALDGINQAARRAKDLVKQILSFSRKGEQKKRPLALALLAREVLQLIRQTVPATLVISSDITSTKNIFANATQVHQVLMNLCTNACHAMGQGGGTLRFCLVDRTLERPEAKRDVIVPSGAYVVVQVSDTGAGMEEDVLQKIFEPYFTTKDVGEGTGLGLSVVHGIVADHQGYILVDSKPGLGTEFQIFFPALEGRSMETTGGEEAEPDTL